jgi:hypothetical protein
VKLSSRVIGNHLLLGVDRNSIESAVVALGAGRVDALFNCAGLPNTFPGQKVIAVNFVGSRHITELIIPLMPAGNMRVALVGAKQETPSRNSASNCYQGHPGARNLAIPGVPAQLSDRFVDEPVAVRATGGELAAVGIHRQLSPEADAGATRKKRRSLANAAKTESLQPGEGIEAEPVVDLGYVNILLSQRRAAPEVGSRPEDVGEMRDRALVPRLALGVLNPHGFDQHGLLP